MKAKDKSIDLEKEINLKDDYEDDLKDFDIEDEDENDTNKKTKIEEKETKRQRKTVIRLKLDSEKLMNKDTGIKKLFLDTKNINMMKGSEVL